MSGHLTGSRPQYRRCEQAAGGGTGGHSRTMPLCYGRLFISFAGRILSASAITGRSACCAHAIIFVVTSAIAAPPGAFCPLAMPHPFSNCLAPVVCDLLCDHMSLTTGLTALYAIVATMPLLWMMLRRPDTFADYQQFSGVTKNSGDERRLSLSMLIAPWRANRLYDSNADRLFGGIPDISLSFALPVIVWSAGYRGASGYLSAPCWPFLRPASASMMRLYRPGTYGRLGNWHDGLLFPLSVVTVGEQFNLKTRQLLALIFWPLAVNRGRDIAWFCPWPILPVLWLVIGEYKKPNKNRFFI